MHVESTPRAGVNRLPRLAATTALHSAVIRHLDAAAAWLGLDDEDREDRTPPRLAIAGEAGLGKTDAVLRGIATPEWKKRRVLYLVPSIDLADELRERASAMGIDARVIRGRSQALPGRPDGSDDRMCRKWQIAEGVASLGYNVTETLCSGTGEDGKKAKCPFADQCAYMRQVAENRDKPGLLIGAHQYLPLKMELLREKDIDLLIIDESFWQSLTRETRVNIDRFKTWRAAGGKGYFPKSGERRKEAEERRQDDTADFHVVHQKAIKAIDLATSERRQPTLEDFRAAGLTTGDCRFAAGIEYSNLGTVALYPNMAEDEQREALKKAVVREAFGFARWWKILGAELATERDELHGIEAKIGHLNPRSGELENIFALSYSAEPRFQSVPVLMIDADADPLIIERFYPESGFETIRAEWQNVRIVQCADRTGSKAAFANPANRERAWNVAMNLADRLAETVAGDAARRPVVIAQKSVREAWEADPEKASPPFDLAHQGALRGKDGWKAAAGSVIVGRIEPSPAEVERLARAVFYKDATPLARLKPDEKGRTQLPKRDVVITAKDGRSATVAVSFHPDERADRILRQVREAELSQALARVRPIHRGADNPCTIIVLTNVPLAVEPDELAPWDSLVPDRFEQMRSKGFLPDVASDCAVAYPAMWDSPTAVRMAASRARRAEAGESVTVSIMNELYEPRYTSMRRIRYNLEGSRRGRGAWVRLIPGEDAEALQRRLQAVLPGLHGLRLDEPLPDPVERPEAAQEAIVEAVMTAEALSESGEHCWFIPPGRETWFHRRVPSRRDGRAPPDLTWLTDS